MAAAPAVFADWAAALQAAGIRRIDGRIIGDDNLFDDEGLGAGWAWDYLEADYAAPVGALQYNEDVAAMTVLPGRAPGEPAVVSLAAGSGLSLDNKALTAAAGTAETIQFRRRLDAPVLEVTGTVPVPASRAAARQRRRPYGGQERRRGESHGLLRAIAEGCARGQGDHRQRRRGRHRRLAGIRLGDGRAVDARPGSSRITAAAGHRRRDDESQPEPLR